ncbi:amino acid ABC transporter permease [Streptomyces zingiberis]|uniref:amino acid ABC transporter permease n=1 Tax=Streptomyces zingiberis TaxID=2053010 RepID=UPI0019D29233|nr:amino acid ABC transporter permease [Streptomyces zingiberis]
MKSTAEPAVPAGLTAQADMEIRSRRSWKSWVSAAVGLYLVLSLYEFTIMNDRWQWDVIWSYLFSQRIVAGVANTILLTVIATVAGLLLGVVTAACRLSDSRLLRVIAYVYIWFSRATPLLVVILFVFFLAALTPRLGIGIPFGPSFVSAPTNDLISRFTAALVGLSLYLGGKSAEIFRAGITSVSKGQFEACRALGLSPRETYQRVIGPQAIRVITPPLSNEVITMFKNTSLVSVIGFSELLTTVQSIYSRTFETIPLLTVAVIWYLLLTSVAMYLQGLLERRFGRGFDPAGRLRRRPRKTVRPGGGPGDVH